MKKTRVGEREYLVVLMQYIFGKLYDETVNRIHLLPNYAVENYIKLAKEYIKEYESL